jgi:hypothetical protein
VSLLPNNRCSQRAHVQIAHLLDMRFECLPRQERGQTWSPR